MTEAERLELASAAVRPAAALPPVPYVDLGPGLPPEGPFWDVARVLLTDVGERLGRRRLALMDGLSRLWLARSGSKLTGELDAIAERAGLPGTYLLNLTYEWACTTAVTPGADGGVRMLRAFDWPLGGIGRHAHALRRTGRAGVWAGLSWPVFAGEVTVFAPGRFVVAINLAPPATWSLRGRRLPERVETLANVLERAVRGRIPPTHLLRDVVERAETAREAVRLLTETPIARAAIFVVSGVRPEEAWIIDRLPATAHVRAAGACAANHFACSDWPGVPHDDSFERVAAMEGMLAPAGAFAWCVPPVVNEGTRYVAELDASQDHFTMFSLEDGEPVTCPTRIAVPV